ncbi:hypothetical protein EV175_002298 [Coemansia sp. RSA 1933]|nr:hypothetical protein EV175_002298 [Coemansia sp. RSA 1933]
MAKLSISAALLLAASSASAYNIYNTNILNCREGPTTDTDRVRTYTMGMNIDIECQIHGQLAFGTDIWDLTQDGCYVLDYYVYTGHSEVFKPLCGEGSSSGNSTSSANNSSPNLSSSSAGKSENSQSAAAGDDHSNSEDSSDASIDEPESGDDSSSEESPDSSSGATHTNASLFASVLTAGAVAGYALSLF